MRLFKFFLFPILLLTALEPSLEAFYRIKDGRFVNTSEIARHPPDYYYEKGMAGYEAQNWDQCIKNLNILVSNFPELPLAQDSFFYLAIAYYEMQEYDYANQEFSNYIKCSIGLRHFQEVMEYKFQIAEAFRNGARRRIINQHIPKWFTARQLACEIYDEVIAAMPNHELTARSLFSKAIILRAWGEYWDSIDCLQTLIRRFPKHELTPESYLLITKIYCQQSVLEYQNPDIQALAEVNVRKFREDFPREERIAQAEADLLAIKEIYARGLFETGCFYEKTYHPQAAMIYYRKTLELYPTTTYAGHAKVKLAKLDPRCA